MFSQTAYDAHGDPGSGFMFVIRPFMSYWAIIQQPALQIPHIPFFSMVLLYRIIIYCQNGLYAGSCKNILFCTASVRIVLEQAALPALNFPSHLTAQVNTLTLWAFKGSSPVNMQLLEGIRPPCRSADTSQLIIGFIS